MNLATRGGRGQSHDPSPKNLAKMDCSSASPAMSDRFTFTLTTRNGRLTSAASIAPTSNLWPRLIQGTV